MAVIPSLEDIGDLKALVKKLHDRVEELERGLMGESKEAKELRMILIGPPGAGMLCLSMAMA